MRNFYIDGTSSATYNIFASGENTYNAAERDVSSIEVPGRSGNLLVDNGRFKNVDVKYPCVIPYGFQNNANNIRAWLMSNSFGYHKITDDYDASHYRMGRVKGGIEFQPMYTNQAAALCDITFDCKPQRFLTSGDVFTEYSAASFTVNNPTAFDSKPIVRLYGTGYVEFPNGAKITVSATSGDYIEFDCETLNAVDSNGANANSKVTVLGVPVLTSGGNAMSKTLTKVKIKPRWWEL